MKRIIETNHKTTTVLRTRPTVWSDVGVGEVFTYGSPPDSLSRVKVSDRTYHHFWPTGRHTVVDWNQGSMLPVTIFRGGEAVTEIEDEEHVNTPLRARDLNYGDAFMFEEDSVKPFDLVHLCRFTRKTYNTVNFSRWGSSSSDCYCSPDDLVVRITVEEG